MTTGLGRQPAARELRAAAAEAGKTIFELPFLWLREHKEVLASVVEVVGWEHVEACRAEQRAILALTPHLGCFDIVASYYGSRAPMTALYRPPKQTDIEPIMRHGRERGQIKLAPVDLSGVRRLVKALRQKEAAGLLPDQVPANGEGVWSPFLGRPAYTMTLAARLSEVADTEVLLMWGERLPRGAGYRVHIGPAHQAIAGTLEARVHRINSEVERMIRSCPMQYLWGYNRYKVPSGVEAPK